MSILVVGSVGYDSIITPSAKHDHLLGGSATYFSVASSLFTETRLVAVVGTDFKREHVDLLRARAIDLEGLEIVEGATFAWGGRYLDDMNQRTTLFTDLNVFADFQPKLPSSYRQSDYVFLANIHPDLQYSVLEQTDAPVLVACDTMNLWIDTELESLRRLLKRIDMLVINDEEAKLLTGEYHLARAAKVILRMGPRRLIVKRGEYGVVMFSQEGVFAAPGYPLEEVNDPTGAGDAFAGGLMGYLARHGKLDDAAIRRAVIYGSAVGSFAVEDFGLGRLLSLTRAELLERVRGFRSMSSFEDQDL